MKHRAHNAGDVWLQTRRAPRLQKRLIQGQYAEDNLDKDPLSFGQITQNQSCLVTGTLLVFVHRKERQAQEH